MAPKVSEEYLEDRRTHILDAAVVSFSRNGFHQTTIEDIRVEAELSRGALYHYFKTKEDIIDAIRQRSAEVGEAIYEETSKQTDATGRVLDLIEASFAAFTRPLAKDANRLALFLWAESIVNPRIMEGQLESFKPYVETFARDIRAAQEEGKISPDLEPEGVARAITGAILGLMVQLTWEPDANIEAARSVVLAMFTGDFRRDEAAEQSSVDAEVTP